MNIDTGEVKPWDEVTEGEKKGGRWVTLPKAFTASAENRRQNQRVTDVAARRQANKAARAARRKGRMRRAA